MQVRINRSSSIYEGICNYADLFVMELREVALLRNNYENLS